MSDVGKLIASYSDDAALAAYRILRPDLHVSERPAKPSKKVREVLTKKVAKKLKSGTQQ